MNDLRVWSGNGDVDVQKASFCDFESETKLSKLLKATFSRNFYLCAGRDFFVEALFFVRIDFHKIRVSGAQQKAKQKLHFLLNSKMEIVN